MLNDQIDALIIDLALGEQHNIWKFSGIQTGSGIPVIYLDEGELDTSSEEGIARTAKRLNTKLQTFFEIAATTDVSGH